MKNLFATAQPVTKKPAASAKKSDKDLIEMESLACYAQVDAVLKALEGVKETLSAKLKAEALPMFVERAKGKKPESFRAVEGDASASMEMRKRTTRSALTPEEVEILEKFGVTTEKMVTTNKLFGINPKYAENMELLTKVSEAIGKIVPEDFIVVQEEVSTNVVADSTFEDAWRKGATSEIAQIVGTMAIKPKLEITDIKVLLKSVRAHFLTDEEREQEAEEKAGAANAE